MPKPKLTAEEFYLQSPFDLYSNKAWAQEIDARKFARENFHHIVAYLNGLDPSQKEARGYGKDDKAAFRRIKRDDDFTSFQVDYPDGSYLALHYDSNKKFPRILKEDGNEEKKSGLRAFVTNR